MTRLRLLTLRGVHTHIGAYHILHGVDFDGAGGQVTMLLGRNGAGKTTTLRTIMGLWAASQGERRASTAAIGGTDGALAAHARRSRALGIAYVPENMGIFADLRCSENMLLAARAARRARPARHDAARVALRPVPGAEEVLAPPGRQAVGRAEADAGDRARHRRAAPRCCSIDEPSKGLAPAIVHNLIAALARARSAPTTTILLVEQNFQVARALGDRVAVMDNGRVVHRGTMAELADDEALQQRLLGLSLAAHQ